MKTIKTRKKVKGIKTLDKSANLSTRMKDAFIRTKDKVEDTQDARHASPNDYAAENIQDTARSAVCGTAHHFPSPRQKARKNLNRAKSHFQKVKRQLPKERKRAAEQAQKTAHKAKADAEKLRKTADQAGKTAREAKTAVMDAKKTLRVTRQAGRQAIRGVSGGAARPGYLSNGVTAPNKAGNTIEKSAHTVKSTKKGFKESAKGTVKTAKKSVKTAENSAKAAVKTSKQAARTAQKTAQATAKAAKVAEKAARSAAKTAARAAKATAKAIAAMVKLAIAAIKGMIALIAAGGWVAVLVILVICMIGLLVSSIFGIFFSSEPSPETGQTINGVIAEIDVEYTNKLNSIISGNVHDLLDMSGARAAWKQVLAVYTVSTVTDPDNPMEVATMNDKKADILCTVFWDMNTITHILDTVEVDEDVLDGDGLPTGETTTVNKTVLCITVTHKTPEEMAEQFGFTDEQKEWLAELLKPEYHHLWNALLYGITSVGDGSMIEVAITQLGNIGGEPYWSWYGFDSRVEWCACFVSWCAEQCGYIDAEIVPKFSSCEDGIAWYKASGQWRDSGYFPAPGDLIFFDWEGDGISDHVGIVERIDVETVHTIEGNTSDSCARRSYLLGSMKIYGYGCYIS